LHLVCHLAINEANTVVLQRLIHDLAFIDIEEE